MSVKKSEIWVRGQLASSFVSKHSGALFSRHKSISDESLISFG